MNYLFQQQANVGFFSDFNVILGCLNYIVENNISNFNFEWTNFFYQNKNENLFDKYFFNIPKYSSYDAIINALSIGETYYQPYNEHQKFLNSHKILNHFNYFENPTYKRLSLSAQKAEKCVGVHIRGTDHWMHGPLLDLNTYLKCLDKKINENAYEKIFLATDEVKYVEEFYRIYGSAVITNKDIIRSTNTTAIHHSGFQDKEKLAEDVMLDGISLSLCSDLVITSSNVSAYALAVNPHIKYTFLDSPFYKL